MPRYFTRPRAASVTMPGWDGDDGGRFYGSRGGPSSFEVDEHVATDTGLLNGDGDPIWRAPNRIGFGGAFD